MRITSEKMLDYVSLPGVITRAGDPLPFRMRPTGGDLRYVVTFRRGGGVFEAVPVDSDEKELALAVALGHLEDLRRLPSPGARRGFARGVIEAAVDYGDTVPFGTLMVSIDVEI